MAKIDWDAHQRAFDKMRAESGTSLADYIRIAGLQANTARKRLRSKGGDPTTNTEASTPASAEISAAFGLKPRKKARPALPALSPDTRRLLKIMEGERLDPDLIRLSEVWIRKYAEKSEQVIDLLTRATDSFEGVLQPGDEGYVEPVLDANGNPMPPYGDLLRITRDTTLTITECVRAMAQVRQVQAKTAQNVIAQKAAELRSLQGLSTKAHQQAEEEESARRYSDLLSALVAARTRETNPITAIEAARCLELQGFKLPESLRLEVAEAIGSDEGRNDPPISDEQLEADAVAAIAVMEERRERIRQRAIDLAAERANQVEGIENDETQQHAITRPYFDPDDIDREAASDLECITELATTGGSDE